MSGSLLDQAQADRLLLPVEVPQGSEALRLLERIATAIEATGTKSEEAAQKTEGGFARSLQAIGAAAHALNETREAAVAFVEGVNAVAERVAESASQAERLSRAQRELRLDFDAAADGAGGYVDSLEVATTAQTLAERGIRLTQGELNALTRVAQNYARTTGKEFSEAMENLAETVTEGGEELGKFDTALLSVADTARFTAEDRLRALVNRADEISPAARTAAESMRAFEGAIRDADRTFSQGFVETLASFRAGTGDATTKVRELKDEIYAVGATVAEIVERAGQGIGALVAFLGVGIGTVLASLRAVGAGMHALVTRGDVGAAARGEFDDAMTTGFAADAFAFLRDRVEALENIDRERTTMAPPSAGGSAQDQVRDQNARNQRGGGGGGGSSQARAADMSFTQDEATYGEAGLADRAREQAERGLRAQAARERQESEARERAQAEGLLGRERAEQQRVKDRERERDNERKRLENLRSFNEQWRQLHAEQVNVAASAAGSLNAAMGSLGESLASHFGAIVKGQETLSQALRGILSDTLDAIAKEAFAKGGFYFAEGLARLVMYDFPGAGTSFAASAAYFAAGATATGLGALVAAPAQPAGGGAAAAPAPRGAESFGRPSNDNAQGGGQTVVNHYYAPVIGGRDALDSEVGQRMGRYTDAAASRQVRDRGDRALRAA